MAKTQQDWNNIFADAPNTSGPGSHGLTISKTKPNGEGARSIWDDDRDMVEKAAKQFGYSKLVDNKKIVCFIKKRS